MVHALGTRMAIYRVGGTYEATGVMVEMRVLMEASLIVGAQVVDVNPSKTKYYDGIASNIQHR